MGQPLRFVLATTITLVACTGPSDPPAPKAEPAAAAEPAPEPALAQGEPAQGEPAQGEPAQGEPAQGEPVAPPTAAEVAVAPAAPVVVEPETVPVSPIAPSEVSVVWREVSVLDEPIEFVTLIGGALGKSQTSYYAFDESGVIAKVHVETPEAEPFGYWPDNLWYVRLISKGPLPNDRSGEEQREISLMRLRNASRWVPQEFDGGQRFEDAGQDFRIGNKGGLIVSHDSFFTRVAGGSEDPVGGACRNFVVEFVETRSGRLYALCRDDGKMYAVTECEDEDCVAQKSVQLPFGEDWSFALQVPRQRHSVSLAGVAKHEGSEKPHLLHYETGGWKLEGLTAAASGLWPTKDGGLWTMTGSELLHRDPDGGWRKVTLPGGAADVSAAMQGDQSELIIAALVDGQSKVFATHANAQEPVPSTVEPAAG